MSAGQARRHQMLLTLRLAHPWTLQVPVGSVRGINSLDQRIHRFHVLLNMLQMHSLLRTPCYQVRLVRAS